MDRKERDNIGKQWTGKTRKCKVDITLEHLFISILKKDRRHVRDVQHQAPLTHLAEERRCLLIAPLDVLRGMPCEQTIFLARLSEWSSPLQQSVRETE